MSDIFEKEAVPLESYVETFSPIEGQVGALFAIDGRIAGLDLFDAPETFRKLFPKLLRSYGLDALNGARREEAKPAEIGRGLHLDARELVAPGVP